MADETKRLEGHSRDEYEVTSGKLHHLTERAERVTLTQGARFHPTREQVRKGSLKGKARLVKAAGPRVAITPGVEFDAAGNIVRDEPVEAVDFRSLDSLEWGSPAALGKAESEGLTVEELEAVGSTGATGYVTSDVSRALEARASEAGG